MTDVLVCAGRSFGWEPRTRTRSLYVVNFSRRWSVSKLMTAIRNFVCVCVCVCVCVSVCRFPAMESKVLPRLKMVRLLTRLTFTFYPVLFFSFTDFFWRAAFNFFHNCLHWDKGFGMSCRGHKRSEGSSNATSINFAFWTWQAPR